jgi:DNA-binding NarL/FixJ family response regulator
VLRAISNGRTNAEIAGELFLSVNTVRNHVQSVLTKLGAHSKLEAAAIAVREGLVPA